MMAKVTIGPAIIGGGVQTERDLRAPRGLPASLAFETWSDMIDALLDLGSAAPEGVPVIIDEFPNLVAGPGVALADPDRAQSPQPRLAARAPG